MPRHTQTSGAFSSKQKTASEIDCDWSSDVCSSDLPWTPSRGRPRGWSSTPGPPAAGSSPPVRPWSARWSRRPARTATYAALLGRCYDEALRHGYLWHEFGDVHLLLP